MSQLAQLSEAEIEARFHITGRRAVAFTLAAMARDGERFSLHFGDELFLTTLLAADPERATLTFDSSGAEALNRRLLAAGHGVFVGRPEGVHVQFAGQRIRAATFAGRPAFVADLPGYIVRLQRRESFRIETPRAGLPAGAARGDRLQACHFQLDEGAHELACAADIRHLTEREGRNGQRYWRLGLAFDALPAAGQNIVQRYIIRVERERHGLV